MTFTLSIHNTPPELWTALTTAFPTQTVENTNWVEVKTDTQTVVFFKSR